MSKEKKARESHIRKVRLATLVGMALTLPWKRAQHGKRHGCVRAKFQVLEDIPDSCKVGLFAKPATYDALIRFSNGPQRTDRDAGAQGMAIKLLGVPGRKVLPEEADATTHDFILIDGPVFFVRDSSSYARLVGELVRRPHRHPEKWRAWAVQKHAEDRDAIENYHNRVADSPLTQQFWSQVPYALGEKAETICRYTAIPRPGNMTIPIPVELRSENYLRQAMVNQLVLAGQPAAFDFCVQPFVNPTADDIDAPTREWKTPEHRVAVITIPPQDFNRPEQDRLGENLSYTPWHALPDHRPVGQINEIRRSVYALSSRTRHLFRMTPVREPVNAYPPKRTGRLGRIAALGAVAVPLLFAVAVGVTAWVTHIPLPDYAAVERQVWLSKNWSEGQSEWYHHAHQGGQFPPMINVPYEWFLALEQPTLSIGAAPPLSDQGYLNRFGFIPSTSEKGAYDWRSCREPEGTGYDNAKASPLQRHRLPVGFACSDAKASPMVWPDGRPWRNPATGAPMSALGLTCAACHTGRLTFGGTELLVDGGSAMTDIVKLNEAIALALVFTDRDPLRFNRFALRLLGSEASESAKAGLAEQLAERVRNVKELRKLDEAARRSPNWSEEGFGRLDALNRIGNQVFSVDLGKPENYVASSAPVHYPRIWDVPWFVWAQYNASIGQPMVRNAGEALGTGAPVVLQGEPSSATSLTAPLFTSAVQFPVLFRMEQLLAGQQPDEKKGFTGLASPKWPVAVLGPIDAKLAAKGNQLYDDKCAHCHLPAVGSPAFWNAPNWKAPTKDGQRYLDVTLIPVKEVGTDPSQARGMVDRKVALPAELGIEGDSFAAALGVLVERVANRWYESQTPPVSPEKRWEMNGFRENLLQTAFKDEIVYKARPLDGVWATPPYLHNGSVPDIEALLSPPSERPKTFWLGHREYDPKRLGYQSGPLSGGFLFDTTKPGNSNAGHEFDDGPARPGRIGRKLTPDERRALIEYLKTL